MFGSIAVVLALGPLTLDHRTFTVCLDPGHPSENGVGASGFGVREVELVWDLASRVKSKLEALGSTRLRVVMTKHAVDQRVSNLVRAEIANSCHADLFLRLHADSGGVSGFSTYFPDGKARLRGTLGPSDAVIQSSKQLARPFHTAVIQSLNGVLPDLGCRSERRTLVGGKQGALTGTVFSKVPVLLVEVCAVDNSRDAQLVSTETGRARLSQALVAGILAVRKLTFAREEKAR